MMNLKDTMNSEEEFLLKWNNHQSNLIGVFKDWLQDESFVDVTLVCGGEAVSGHKVVLAACSPLLNRILHDNPCRHPVVILNDVCSTDMKALLKFIYQGEVSVSQAELASFLKTADNLQIKGLAEGKDDEKKKDDTLSGGIRKKRKTDIRCGILNQQQLHIHKNIDGSVSSPKCKINTPSNLNETFSGTPLPDSLNHQVENGKSTNSYLQSDSDNSLNKFSKEDVLFVKTEPLDYAGEMVWQESNSNILSNSEIVTNTTNTSSTSSNGSVSNNTSNFNSSQNPEIHSSALPFVVLHPSLENIDSTSTADILQKNLELVLSAEEKRSEEEEVRNISLANDELNQSMLNVDQSIREGGDGGFKDLVEDSPDIVKEECDNGNAFCDDADSALKIGSTDPSKLEFRSPSSATLPYSGTESATFSVVTPFSIDSSSSGSYYIMNGTLLCCKRCSYQSRNPYTFNRHLRIHFGNKEFKCSHCDYATTRKDSLMRHVRVKH